MLRLQNNMKRCFWLNENNTTYVDYHDNEWCIPKYKDQELFVIGGKTVYDQTINHADYLYITFIRKEYIGDVYFSKFDLDSFEEIERTDLEEISFVIYKRK